MKIDGASRNLLEIRLIAMRRSGSHGFLNWLFATIPGKGCFINDATRRINIKSDDVSNDLPSLIADNRVSLADDKSLLAYNLEDVDLNHYGKWWIPAELAGASSRKITILLLRDPYNMFASRLKTYRNMPDNNFAQKVAPPCPIKRRELARLWLQYANEFLGVTSLIEGTLIKVNYNLWAFNSDYRSSLCQLIGGTNPDAGLRQVPRYGFGSSFEGYRSGELKNRLGLLHRWRHYQDDPDYLDFISEPGLNHISNEIFGTILNNPHIQICNE